MTERFTDADIIAVLRGEASPDLEKRLLSDAKSDERSANLVNEWRAILERINAEQPSISAINDRVTTRVMARLGTEAVADTRRWRITKLSYVPRPFQLSAALAALFLVIAGAGMFFMGSEPGLQYQQENLEGKPQSEQHAMGWASAQSMSAVVLTSNSLIEAVENTAEGGELIILAGTTAQGIVIRKRLRLVSEGGAVVIGLN